MKFQLSPIISDIFITVYIIATLYFRIIFENNTQINPLLSILLGIGFIAIIWVLIKLKVLNPNWFGLFKLNKN